MKLFTKVKTKDFKERKKKNAISMYRKWNQGEQIQFKEKKRKNLDPGGMYIVLDNEMISHAFLFEWM